MFVRWDTQFPTGCTLTWYCLWQGFGFAEQPSFRENHRWSSHEFSANLWFEALWWLVSKPLVWTLSWVMQQHFSKRALVESWAILQIFTPKNKMTWVLTCTCTVLTLGSVLDTKGVALHLRCGIENPILFNSIFNSVSQQQVNTMGSSVIWPLTETREHLSLKHSFTKAHLCWLTIDHGSVRNSRLTCKHQAYRPRVGSVQLLLL